MMNWNHYYAVQAEYQAMQREAVMLTADQDARAAEITTQAGEIAGRLQAAGPVMYGEWQRDQWAFEADMEIALSNEANDERNSRELREQFQAAAERHEARQRPSSPEYQEWAQDQAQAPADFSIRMQFPVPEQQRHTESATHTMQAQA